MSKPDWEAIETALWSGSIVYVLPLLRRVKYILSQLSQPTFYC
ncbi:hypothetical protein AZ020_002256 [Enterobacter hormaechei]|nr:hypothetical protein L360_01966 [Enterobacter sp. MGH 14]KLW83715.1 hypothetical protein SK61_02136 [Enterobacter sp. BIDMC100]OUF04911.1 hypothetical protein AZ020_002256 [Enterobacter hormaechei]OUF30159.1 hypothetical protein AZ038_002184 [Enterobacter hormaechei]VAE33095.1 Uncharacterised protein [Enterobacter hormaechei]